MSMRPHALPEVPEQTAVVAKAAFRKGTLAMRVRDELGEVFADGAFIDAFGIRGKPGISPGQLAMVTVLQFAEKPHRSAGRRRGRTFPRRPRPPRRRASSRGSSWACG